jgi:ClpX C4-type zinc finger
VQKLIAGSEVFICDGCVDLCTGIVEPDDDKELFPPMRGNEETGGEPVQPCSSWLAGHPRKSWRTTWNVAGKAWSVTASPCKVFSADLR